MMKTKMTKSEKQEIDAAIEYCKKNPELDIIYNQIADAFLAGVVWQKQRSEIKPDKEYYGG